jgi:hypothetical protein
VSHIKQTLKFGGGSIMALGAITSKGVGELVRIEKNVTSEEYILGWGKSIVSFISLK